MVNITFGIEEEQLNHLGSDEVRFTLFFGPGTVKFFELKNRHHKRHDHTDDQAIIASEMDTDNDLMLSESDRKNERHLVNLNQNTYNSTTNGTASNGLQPNAVKITNNKDIEMSDENGTAPNGMQPNAATNVENKSVSMEFGNESESGLAITCLQPIADQMPKSKQIK